MSRSEEKLRGKGCWRWSCEGEEKRKRRLDMDVVIEDMQMVGVTVEKAGDGVRWRKMICWGDP